MSFWQACTELYFQIDDRGLSRNLDFFAFCNNLFPKGNIIKYMIVNKLCYGVIFYIIFTFCI
jgi:hypothetical protein